MDFTEIEKHFINLSINKVINEGDLKNYKLIIRKYLIAIFKNESKEKQEKIIQEAQKRFYNTFKNDIL